MADKATQIFASVTRHLEGVPETNWDAVAKECGYKDASNAKTMFKRFRAKLTDRAEDPETPGTPQKNSKPAASTKKRAATDTPSRAKRLRTAKPVDSIEGNDKAIKGEDDDVSSFAEKISEEVNKKIESDNEDDAV
ncbi:MAG: hypothetical protein M1828_002477 [Chrysothrix sp. TS-e1954]|nr:MAG: hypothetical protein M1828_002477 [Chrysothrix sp. TS-e1954]